MVASKFTNHISTDHREKRARLGGTFPAARDFLEKLAGLHDETGRFHLGTDQNLHLYLDHEFLAYIRIEPPSSIAISPKFHIKIKPGTTPAPERFFTRLREIIEKHGGRGRWVSCKDDDFRIGAAAPGEFFDDLLAALRALT